VLLEAAAIGLPTVTTNATGARDAIIAGKTGLQVPIGDPNALTAALATLVRDPSLRDEMGRAGRTWVCEHFDQSEVWRRQAEQYRALASGTSRRPVVR
jgi:glycosyltransferase involved in cell wall biosynthesis